MLSLAACSGAKEPPEYVDAINKVELGDSLEEINEAMGSEGEAPRMLAPFIGALEKADSAFTSIARTQNLLRRFPLS